jgi:hypothetical protein
MKHHVYLCVPQSTFKEAEQFSYNWILKSSELHTFKFPAIGNNIMEDAHISEMEAIQSTQNIGS